MGRMPAFPLAAPAATIRPVMRGTRSAPSRLQPLLESYRAVRAQSELLAEPLSAEDQTVQSMPDVSPTKWHLAHTSWFFETFVLRAFAPEYSVFHPKYEVLFNSYYNSIGAQFPRAHRGLLSRPGKQEVQAYRKHVDLAMEAVFGSLSPEALSLVELGLQHEQQHQELLLTDIKHVLSQNPLRPIYREGDPVDAAALEFTEPTFVGFEGGLVEIGHEGDGFHYDNEGPRHRTLLADFELASRPVSNAEVITFIEAGGYDDPLLWLSDGWAHIKQQRSTAPLYFERTESGWAHFTLHGLLPVDPTETACHLNYFEADAIARFFGARLPTEQEWEHAMTTAELLFPELRLGTLRPGRPKQPRPRGTLQQALGGVWEWTQSPYVPYPGYEPPPGAVGEYNGKFMHNQFVLRGGSCVTPTGHVRATYRNFFPSSASWQFSGARLARGNNTP